MHDIDPEDYLPKKGSSDFNQPESDAPPPYPLNFLIFESKWKVKDDEGIANNLTLKYINK